MGFIVSHTSYQKPGGEVNTPTFHSRFRPTSDALQPLPISAQPALEVEVEEPVGPGARLPNELVGLIAPALQQLGLYGTLAKFALTSKAYYRQVIPLLYETMVITTKGQNALPYGYRAAKTPCGKHLVATDRRYLGSRKKNCDCRTCRDYRESGGKPQYSHRPDMEAFEHDTYLFIDGIDEPEHPYGRIYVQTRKDLATLYCRRLIIDAALTEGCLFDSPWTMWSNVRYQYRNATEVVITAKAAEETGIAYHRPKPSRNVYRLNDILSELYDFTTGRYRCSSDTEDPIYRLAIHCPPSRYHMSTFLQRWLYQPHHYSDTSAPISATFSYQVDIIGFPLSLEDPNYGAWPWTNRPHGIRFSHQIGKYKTRKLALAKWLADLYDPNKNVPQRRSFLTGIPRAPTQVEYQLVRELYMTKIPKLVLYDVPRLIIGIHEIPKNKAKALQLARDKLREAMLELPDLKDNPDLVDDILSMITMEMLGSRGVEYPTWKPVPPAIPVPEDVEEDGEILSLSMSSLLA